MWGTQEEHRNAVRHQCLETVLRKGSSSAKLCAALLTEVLAGMLSFPWVICAGLLCKGPKED